MKLLFIRIFFFVCLTCLLQNLTCIAKDNSTNSFSKNKFSSSIKIKDGVINLNNNLKVQAKHISCINTNSKGDIKFFATDNVMVIYKNYTLIGDIFEYNEEKNICYLSNGKFSIFPWFISGKKIDITPKEIVVSDGYLSTSETEDKEVLLKSKKIIIDSYDIIHINNLILKVRDFPLLWLPKLSLKSSSITKPPFGIRGGFGGFLGPYLGVNFSPFYIKQLSNRLFLDYFFKHGIGIGANFQYESTNNLASFKMKNYYAHKLSIISKEEKDRYRYKGNGNITLKENSAYFQASYDITDSWETITDIFPEKKGSNYIKNTTLCLGYLNKLGSILARTKFKVNDFQNINKELPYCVFHSIPFLIPKVGCIFDTKIETGFLNFNYSSNISSSPSFRSFKFYASPQIYKPFSTKIGRFTPLIGGKFIYYSNTSEGRSKQQLAGYYSCQYNCSFIKKQNTFSHLFDGYLTYQGITKPSLSNREHYIFTINDSLHLLNLITGGLKNKYLFLNQKIKQELLTNIGLLSLIGKTPSKGLFPKGFICLEYKIKNKTTLSIFSQWIIKKNIFDYANFSWLWSTHPNLAFITEFFYRSKYSWKKANENNFILDVSRNEIDLLSSVLSEKRSLIVNRIFFRPHPQWEFLFNLNYGSFNKDFKDYLEYSLTLDKKIFEHWKFKTTFEHKENQQKILFSITLDTI